MLWEAFRDKLGISELQNIDLDLSNLLQLSEELHILDQPFTKEEIDQVVKDLPSDKSPGPDGFNTDFIKKNVGILLPQTSMFC